MLSKDKVRADLHIHTKYSVCSSISIKSLIKACKRRGIDYVAITDHNTISGAIEADKSASRTGIKVIIGEEIRTRGGEIIGLFLNEKIKPHFSPEETVDRIKEQGGIVYVPHLFDRLRRSRLKVNDDDNFWKKVDIIEVFNSRCLFSADNVAAKSFARKLEKIYGAGSDAHTELEIGNSFVLIDDFNSTRTFLRSLKKGRIVGTKSPLFVHAFTKILKILRNI